MASPRQDIDVELMRVSSTQSPGTRNYAEATVDDAEASTAEPIDGGRAAWRMLITAFIFESLLWGFPLSFGVFQNYYSSRPEYRNQPYVSVIGTVASGISYMGAPIIIPFLKRARKYRSHMIWSGWLLCIAGILGSSFTHTLGLVIFCQGVMYGVGFTIFYYPILAMVNEYWVARRGMAYGLLCSASGFSGVIFPFTLEALLSKYGSATTLRAVAVGLTVTTGPLILFLKGRPAAVEEQYHSAPTNWSFLRVPLFWIYAVSNLMQGFGYFFPSLYLPSYATSIGLSARMGALLLAVMCVSQVFGQFSFGYLSDRRLSINTLALSSSVITAIAVLAIWGLSRSLALLCVFAIIYGFFGAGYTALWGRMGTAVTSDSTSAFAAFGLFNFGKGLGNVMAGPISAGLLKQGIDRMAYAASRYETVVIFTGSCMVASAATAAVAYLRPWKAATL
jgi:predicted MFS family arabinose efflux permease